MITITDEQIAEARKKIAEGDPEAVGYRLMVFTIDAITELEAVQIERMPTLAAQGFITKTDDQAEKESRGSHFGILVSIGNEAYKNVSDKVWVEVGDILIFHRYVGETIELPPGSGQMFRFTNDESVLGRIK